MRTNTKLVVRKNAHLDKIQINLFTRQYDNLAKHIKVCFETEPLQAQFGGLVYGGYPLSVSK